MYKVIMAPTEGSDSENTAISVAVKLAQRFNAELRLVRVEAAPIVRESVPRVPVLETAQQLLGSHTPVLMDIATAANFPCQRPFSEHLGVAELPEYRILPNFKQVVVSSKQWQSAEGGGPFLFIQSLLGTTTVPTYLRDDWYRDWGWIERYNRVVPAAAAPNAVIDQGSKRVFGWSRSGPIRALP